MTRPSPPTSSAECSWLRALCWRWRLSSRSGVICMGPMCASFPLHAAAVGGGNARALSIGGNGRMGHTSRPARPGIAPARPPTLGPFQVTDCPSRSAHVSLAEKDNGEGRELRATRLACCVRLPVGRVRCGPGDLARLLPVRRPGPGSGLLSVLAERHRRGADRRHAGGDLRAAACRSMPASGFCPTGRRRCRRAACSSP